MLCVFLNNNITKRCQLIRLKWFTINQYPYLQVLKSTATFRAPDCFQKTPRKVQISDMNGQILTIAVDGQGIHAIVRSGSKLSYVVYNICSGRVEIDNPFPSDTMSFMGLNPHNISLTCAAEVSDNWFSGASKL